MEREGAADIKAAAGARAQLESARRAVEAAVGELEELKGRESEVLQRLKEQQAEIRSVSPHQLGP